MKPIAMRMTQEEFDSIKDLINLPIKLNDLNFDLYCWVTNDRNGEGIVCNLQNPNHLKFERKVYEYFDKDIFLKACDIEVEKIFDGSELQFLNVFGEWQNCPLNNKYRIKPEIDYSKEIAMLQDKARTNGFKAIITFEKL